MFGVSSFVVSAVCLALAIEGLAAPGGSAPTGGGSPGPASGIVASINEVNSKGVTNAAPEFVEIIARAGTDLSNCRLVHYNGSASQDGGIFQFQFPAFVVPDDGITDSDGNALGFAVIAADAANVPNTDFLLPGTVQDGPDGLALYDADGNILDAVAWEGAGDLCEDDPGTVVTTGVATAVNFLHVIPDDGSTANSLQAPNDVTGDNGTGWALGSPTPGAVNVGQQTGQIRVQSTAFTPLRRRPVLGLLPNAGTNRWVVLGETLAFRVTAIEPDGDAVNLSAGALPQGGVFIPNPAVGTRAVTNEMQWTPSLAAKASVRFQAWDIDGTNCLTVWMEAVPRPGGPVWINEFHYDNASSDTNEGVEIAGRAGTDLGPYAAALYNGKDGRLYDSRSLSGVVDHEVDGFGAVWFEWPRIQNGNDAGSEPDGVALFKVQGGITGVVQFLSYEGRFTATDGPAKGWQSVGMGVAETDATPLDQALQLKGCGLSACDFRWSGPSGQSRGSLNAEQRIRLRGTIVMVR